MTSFRARNAVYRALNVQAPEAETIRDTVHLIDQQSYIELLENVNQQLATGWGPANFFIAALGVLFAVGAIVAALLLYRQDRSHRQAIAAFFDEQRSILAAIQEDTKAQIEAVVADGNARLDQARAELVALMTEENRERIESAIAELDRRRLIGPSAVPNMGPTGESTGDPTLRHGLKVGDYIRYRNEPRRPL